MARKTEKRWNIQKCPLQDVEYGKKTENHGKFRNVHCRTWNMARKLKIIENEKHPLDDLKNAEITKKREK